MRKMFAEIERLLETFGRSNEGAVAVLFGFSFLVVLLSAGIAIDYARAFSIQTALQNDLDAAILGGAVNGEDDEQVALSAQTFFDANWKSRHGVQSDIEVKITKSNENAITGTLKVKVPTTFMRLAGFETVEVAAGSQIEVASKNVEIAMVLDVTESMAGSKIDSLKTSAKALIEKAYEGKKPDSSIKFSLVPFSDYVNVGLANRSASWMSVPSDSTTPKTYCGYYSDVTSTSNCRMETYTSSNDGVPYSYQAQVCDYTYAPPEYRCNDYTETEAWHGCAGSRAHPLNTLDEQFTTKVPGIMNAVCGAEVTPLVDDEDIIKAKVDALTTVGNTFIPSGLFWGWATLSKQAPYEEATDYNEKINGAPVDKVMVLMTDGANTRSPDYSTGAHTNGDVAIANALTAETCTNIKSAGISIHTVAFDVVDDDIKNILRDCASSPSQFYDAGNSAELQIAFESIGSNLAPLRITR